MSQEDDYLLPNKDDMGRPQSSNLLGKLINITIFAALTLSCYALSLGHVRDVVPISQPIKFKIYDQNIRYATTNPGTNEKPWSDRKYEIAESIRFNTFDGNHTVVTLQEVLNNQLNDIIALLNQDGDKDWTYFGVGRNDGVQAGEYSPILYKKSQFELVDGGNFWLSPTPNVPSKGWDADQVRICSWTKLKPIGGGKFVYVYNTHFDHIGVAARRESAKLISSRVNLSNDGINFVTGDLNSEENGEAYQEFSKVFKDSRKNYVYGYGFKKATFTGFVSTDKPQVLDYIFIDPRLGNVTSYGVLANVFDGIYSSDHRPVVIEAFV